MYPFYEENTTKFSATIVVPVLVEKMTCVRSEKELAQKDPTPPKLFNSSHFWCLTLGHCVLISLFLVPSAANPLELKKREPKGRLRVKTRYVSWQKQDTKFCISSNLKLD